MWKCHVWLIYWSLTLGNQGMEMPCLAYLLVRNLPRVHLLSPLYIVVEQKLDTINRMGATSGTGTVYPSWAPEFTPSFFVGFMLLFSFLYCVLLFVVYCPYSCSLIAIVQVLSVILQFTASDDTTLLSSNFSYYSEQYSYIHV